MRALFLALALSAALVGVPASAQKRPPGYLGAEQSFEAMPVADRVRLEIMLTAAGYWPSVPNEDFSGRLFEAIAHFQTEAGYAPTGYLTSDQLKRLAELGQPVLDALGLRAVPHPYRRYPLWVPMGLGLVEIRTPRGISFTDPQHRLKIDYEYYPRMTLGRSYSGWLASLAGARAQISFKSESPDFFVILAKRGDQSWYVRFQRDAEGVLGFSLTYLNSDPSLHGLPLQTLMSASMWSAMTPGAVSLAVPEPSVPAALPPPTPPETPQPPPSDATPTPAAPAPAPEAKGEPAPAPEAKGEPTPAPAPSAKEASGTGFFVNAAGLVLTNAHLVEGCSSIEVPGPNGPFPVPLLAKDTNNDLALLKSGLAPPKTAQLGLRVRLGDPVTAFGYPLLGVLSTTGNFTQGSITSLTGLKDDTRYVQISAPVQPGNSGGPLLDAGGNVVGVVSAKLDALLVMLATNGDIPQNVNFAIKSSVAATFLESNGVSFSTGTPGAAIPPADLADMAKAMSLPVLCK